MQIRSRAIKSIPILALTVSTLWAVYLAKTSYSFDWQSPIVIRPPVVISKRVAVIVQRETEYKIPESEQEWTGLLLAKKAQDNGLSTEDIALLTKIGKCESGLRNVPNRSGASSAIGAFQELAMHNNKGNRSVTEGNLDIAIKLYKTQGTKPWESSKFCWNQ